MNRRPVVGYEGLYEVSDEGYVYSTSRKLKGHLSMPDDGGYSRVVLRKGGVAKNFRVHRLVAIAFIDNPNNLPQVNHIDGNKKNNHLSNLEWCDCKENIEKSPYHQGLKKKVTAISRYTNEKMEFNSMSEAETLGFDRNQISRCCQLRLNSYKGYKWSYHG